MEHYQCEAKDSIRQTPKINRKTHFLIYLLKIINTKKQKHDLIIYQFNFLIKKKANI